MSQRHYLLNTNIDSSNGEALQEALDTERGRVIEIAECVNFVPLPWFACFRQINLRPCTIQMTSGNLEILVPVADLPTAIANLKEALPLFEELTGEKKYSREYWKNAINDLEQLPLPFLTMDIGEMLMNCEADELVARVTSALGRTTDSLSVIRQFFLEYNDCILPYGRAEFYANNDITDRYRIGNTIALDAAIRTNGFARTKQQYSPHQTQQPQLYTPATKTNYAVEQVSSKAMYERAYQCSETKDFEQSVFWYRKAIELADANPSKSTNMFENGSAAECNLADKYEHGLGVPLDYQLALEWYQKSAAKGNCVAQFSLGTMHKNGFGTPQDTAKAFDWFQQSARQGYSDAESQLAELSATALRQNLATKNGFAAGTLVHTKAGLRPIEALQVGDFVLTWPEDKSTTKRESHPFRLEDEYIYKPVTKTFVHENQMISHVLVLENDDNMIQVTPNHSVWSKCRGWVQASVLKFGHTLVLANFANTLARRTMHDVERVTVYNIEVSETHTYFIGRAGYWVHS